MQELTENIQNEPVLQFPLDFQGQDILIKLARWSKFIGVFLIIMGILNCLTIFTYSGNILMLLFALALGVFLVYLGTRLTSSAAHLRYSVNQLDSGNFVTALDQLRTYLFLTGVMYLTGLIVVLVIVIMIAVFGVALQNFTT